MLNQILSIDLFGLQPTFRILDKPKYNTTLGFCFTLFLIGLSTFYLVLGFLEIYDRSSPVVLQSDHQLTDSSAFPLTNQNFTLAIVLADLNSQPIKPDPRYFNISLINCQTIRNVTNNGTSLNYSRICANIPLEICTMDNFVTQIQKDYFSKIRLGYSQCIQKDYLLNHPPQLQGIKTSNIFSALTVQVQLCQNTTNSSNCASQEEITKKLSSGYYGVHMTDNLLQFNQPENISQEIINMQYNSFSISSSKNLINYFRVIQATTDTGLISTDKGTQQVLVQDVMREASDYYNGDYLVLHNILLNSKQSFYDRSYLKLTTMLSRVGGLYQLIYLIMAALLKPITSIMLDIDMANAIFKVEESHAPTDTLNTETSKRRCLISNLDASNITVKLDQFWKNRNHGIQRTWFLVFKILLGCEKQLTQILAKAKDLYMQKLDVQTIVSKSYEFEQLLKLMLNEHQRKLFRCLQKPNLDQEHKKQKLEITLPMALDAFQKVNTKKSQMDCIILEQLDQDLLNILYSASTSKFLSSIPMNESIQVCSAQRVYSSSIRRRNRPRNIELISVVEQT